MAAGARPEALRLGRVLFIMQSILESNPELVWPRRMQDYGALILKKPEDLLELLPYAEPETLRAFRLR